MTCHAGSGPLQHLKVIHLRETAKMPDIHFRANVPDLQVARLPWQGVEGSIKSLALRWAGVLPRIRTPSAAQMYELATLCPYQGARGVEHLLGLLHNSLNEHCAGRPGAHR